MNPVWAQRRVAVLSDCLVSSDVFTPMVDRLDEFIVPYQRVLVRRESAQYECRKTRGMQVPHEPLELSIAGHLAM